MKNLSSTSLGRKYTPAVLATGGIVIVYALINLFVIGGDAFVYTLNNNITIPLSIVTTIFAFSLWSLVSIGATNRKLWGGLLAGWSMWTIAESLWVVYGTLYQEVPYPSMADFFWLLGYIPMGYGFYFRGREIPTKLTQTQRMVLWVISLVSIALVVIFVLVPIIQSNDPGNWLESLLNLLYPLADLFLLLILLRLIFVYGSGDYGFGWNMLAVGFVLHSISNLIFSYASQFDIYYPDLQMNLISGLVIDVPYNLSYVFWLLGLFVLRGTLSQYRSFGQIESLTLIPNTSILIYLGGDNSILETSGNIKLISDIKEPQGASLKELLGISQKDEQNILDILQSAGKITDHPLEIKVNLRNLVTGYLSGIMIRSPMGDFSGANLLLRILIEDDYSSDEALTREHKYMVSHLQKASGSNEEARISKLLLGYHLAYLRQLYNLTYRTGGAQLCMAFLENLRRAALARGSQIQFDPEALIVASDYPLADVRETLPALVDESKRFVMNLTDPETVDAEMQFVSSQFSSSVLRNVKFYS